MRDHNAISRRMTTNHAVNERIVEEQLAVHFSATITETDASRLARLMELVGELSHSVRYGPVAREKLQQIAASVQGWDESIQHEQAR